MIHSIPCWESLHEAACFSRFGMQRRDVAALGGAVVGTSIGLRWLSQVVTRLVLAAILLAAGVQLLFL